MDWSDKAALQRGALHGGCPRDLIGVYFPALTLCPSGPR